ncbi:MAG: pantetheine-phosphate adenylyltransferase [Muribaculum sp.]|nr:pantetheine-phosphate adenylyltransferase [Muribaculum sp.]
MKTTPKSDITAIFPGSFNPFTIGHADIVERALRLFGKVIIAIGYNEHKRGATENLQTRINAIKDIYRDSDRVLVATYSGLTADFARQSGASVIVRGIRSAADFDYEKTLADVNADISDIETIFLPCKPSLAFISSSMVRELSHNGYDINRFLPNTLT